MLENVLPKSSLAILLLAVAATGIVAATKSRAKPATAGLQSEVSINLNRLPGNPGQYSLVISDEDENVVSGTFSVNQLQILKAIMVEAEKFALSEEAVGTKEPITTRFMDKQAPAFIVDVQKAGNQSKLFLTFQLESGRMTWEAGRTTRSTRREDGFFFSLVSRLESLLPKLPAQPRK